MDSLADTVEAVIAVLARQHGLIAARELCRMEPDRGRRRRIVHRLHLRRVTPTVWGSPLFEDGQARRLLLRVVDAGAVAGLWGPTAATWWGFGRFRLTPVHVARPRARRSLRRPDDATLHHIEGLDDSAFRVERGVPTSTPERTWLWLCRLYTHRFSANPDYAQQKCADALEHAWSQGLVDARALHSLVETSGGRGRSGIVHARAVLEDRPVGYRPYGSNTERRFLELLPADVGRHFDRQVPLRDHAPVGVVDFRLRTWPLVVEINGERWHSSIPDRAADDDRYRRLMALGFSVLVWWEHDVWHDASVLRQRTVELVRRPDPQPTLHRPTRAPWDV